MLDVRNACVSKADIEKARKLVSSAAAASKESGEWQDKSSKELARARRLLDAVVHVDTGKVVWAPLRIGAIVPMNMSLDALMLAASSSGFAPAIVGAQLANQCYNAAHYYANANKSNENRDGARRVAAFGLAAGSSVVAALLVNRLARRVASAALSVALRRVAPFLAVASADVINVATMRANEWLEGIFVYDAESGERLAQPSRRAGALAVSQCIVSRVAAAAPVLLLPPFVLAHLERDESAFLRRKPYRRWLRYPLLILMLGAMIQFSVPASFALFRQRGEVDTALLEKEFQSAAKRVYYNKGL
jgi:Sideroflexins